MARDDRQLRILGWVLHAAGLLPLLVGGLTVYLGVLRPLHAHRESMARRAAALERILGNADEVTRAHKEASALIDETRKRAEDVRRQIPEEPQEAEFLREVTRAADAQGVVVKSYSPGESVGSETYSKLDVRLSCEGGYTGLCGFLDHFSTSQRAATIKRMEIIVPQGANSYPLEITLSLYFGLPQQEQSQNSNVNG